MSDDRESSYSKNEKTLEDTTILNQDTYLLTSAIKASLEENWKHRENEKAEEPSLDSKHKSSYFNSDPDTSIDVKPSRSIIIEDSPQLDEPQLPSQIQNRELNWHLNDLNQRYDDIDVQIQNLSKRISSLENIPSEINRVLPSGSVISSKNISESQNLHIDKSTLYQVLNNKDNQELLSFAKGFCLRLAEFNKPDKPSYKIPRDNRRFDAIARLLELDPKDCTAVLFNGQDLYVATNSDPVPHINAQYFDPDHKENPIEPMKALFDSPMWKISRKTIVLKIHLTKIANNILKMRQKNIEVSSYHEYLYNYRYALLSATLPMPMFAREDKDIASGFEEMLIEFCRYENKVTTASTNIVDDWWNNYEKTTICNLSKGEQAKLYVIKRYLKDIVKVEQFIESLPSSDPFLQWILGKRQIELVSYGDGVHAEMNLAIKSLELGNKINYIGISKLCCAHCTVSMNAFNLIQLFDNDEVNPIRGFHGNAYHWPMPDKLQQNTTFLQNFLGSKLFSEYQALTKDVVIQKQPRKTISKQEFAMHIIQEVYGLSKAQLTKLGIEHPLKDNNDTYASESVSSDGGVKLYEATYFEELDILIYQDTYYADSKVDLKVLSDIFRHNVGGYKRIKAAEHQKKDWALKKKSFSITKQLSEGSISSKGKYSIEAIENLLALRCCTNDIIYDCQELETYQLNESFLNKFLILIVNEGKRVILVLKYGDEWLGYLIRKQHDGSLAVYFLDPYDHNYNNELHVRIMECLNQTVMNLENKLHFVSITKPSHVTDKEIISYLLNALFDLAYSVNLVHNTNAIDLTSNINAITIMQPCMDAHFLYEFQHHKLMSAEDNFYKTNQIDEQLATLGYNPSEISKLKQIIKKKHKLTSQIELYNTINILLRCNELPFVPLNKIGAIEERTENKIADKDIYQISREFSNAIYFNNIDMVKTLVKRGFNLRTKLPDTSKTSLHAACHKSSLQMVEELLKLGADVNALTDEGFSPLHFAAQRGNVEIIHILLKAGANSDDPSEFGNSTTPLQEAVIKGRIAAIKLLMAVGANPNYREKQYNCSAFDFAKNFGQEDAGMELLGYQKAFICRVRKSLSKQAQLFNQTTAPGQYFANLNAISEQLASDQYFLELKALLAQNYENIKSDVSIIRKPIVGLMKQYNADKAYDAEVKRELGLVNRVVVNPVRSETSQLQIK